LVGLCPFHGEKSPSFHVHPDQGFFKCFGCGVGGDVLTFVQKQENIGFTTRCACWAAYGVELEDEDPRARACAVRKKRSTRQRRRARVLSPHAARPREGAAKEYCENRGITTRRSSVRARLRTAEWDALVDELRRNDVAAEIAVKAG